MDYKIANCCNPIPGDSVFGFITVSDGIKVHKNNCPNAIQLQSNYAYRIISAKWIDSTQEDFRAIIKLTGIDNLGLVNTITKEISREICRCWNCRRTCNYLFSGISCGRV